MNIPQHMIDDYEARSGLEFVNKGFFLVDQTGFCSYDIHSEDSTLFVYQCYSVGSGEKWVDTLERIGRKHECVRLMMVTKRNPLAFQRHLGFEPCGFLMEREIEQWD